MSKGQRVQQALRRSGRPTDSLNRLDRIQAALNPEVRPEPIENRFDRVQQALGLSDTAQPEAEQLAPLPSEDDFSAIDQEISDLEAELAGIPTLTEGPQFQPPQVPELPGAEMFQNPLLQAIQGDVTRRLMANRAARGKLGSGGTALALQEALAPTALNLGLTQQARQSAQQQQNIDNLFRLFGMGANVASGQGQAGLQGASGIGTALQAGGQAQAAGALGRGQAIQQGLGGLSQIGGYLSNQQPAQAFTGELFGGAGGFRPTVQSAQAAGPLTAAGSFFEP